MRRLGKKKYLLCLKGTNLIGVELHKGKPRKVIDTSLDALSVDSDVAGDAVLLLDNEDVQHQIISVPARGKLSLKQMMAHEVKTLMEHPSSEIVYDWRKIGSGAEEGIPRTLYLLAVYHRPEIIPLLEKVELLGLKLTKVVSSLDLLIEKGSCLPGKGGSGLMVFEAPFVHFLFFQNGAYGFQRSFELREEGFQKDFLLEIQRSFFYTKQKFKIPIERVGVLLAPQWLQGDMHAQLQETLGVPVDLLSPKLTDCAFPELKLLNIMISEASLLPSLLTLLPAEITREMNTRKAAWAVTFGEAVLLSLALLWTYNTHQSLKRDIHLYGMQASQMASVEARVESERDRIKRFKKLQEENALVKNHLSRTKFLRLYLETLPFLVPEQVHLESIHWGSSLSESPVKPTAHPSSLGRPAGANLMVIRGKVDARSADEKYARFFEFLDRLKSAPFVAMTEHQSEDLLTDGRFQLSVQVKEIQPHYAAH